MIVLIGIIAYCILDTYRGKSKPTKKEGGKIIKTKEFEGGTLHMIGKDFPSINQSSKDRKFHYVEDMDNETNF